MNLRLMIFLLFFASIDVSISWSSFQQFAKYQFSDVIREQLNLTDGEAVRSVKLALMYSLITPFNNLVTSILAENETAPVSGVVEERSSYLYFDKMWKLSELADDSRVETICEVGFNRGYSALNFLVANPHARLISFDIFTHRHVPAAVRALHEMFADRELIVVAGSSHRSIKSMTKSLKEQCNLIYIDGSQSPYGLLNEIEDLKHVTNRTFSRIIVDGVEDPSRLDAWKEMAAYQPFAMTEVIESRVFSCLAWVDHSYGPNVDSYKFHFDGSESEYCPVIYNARSMAVGYFDHSLSHIESPQDKVTVDPDDTAALLQPLPPIDTTLVLERIQELQENCNRFVDSSEQYYIGSTGTWCLKDYPPTDRDHPVFKDYVLQWERFKASPKYASIGALLPRPAVFHNPPDVPLARVIAEFITGYGSGDHEEKDALEETYSCDNDDGHGGSTSSTSCTSTSSALSESYNSSTRAQNSAIVTLIDVGAGLGQYGAVFDADATASHHPPSRVVSWTGYDGAGNVDSFTGGRVKWIDVTDPRFDTITFTADWIMSLEVAEHIPANATDNYLSLLDRHNKYGIILSWARRGQGGHGHVNERNNDEVIALLKGRGYYMDEWTNRFTDAGRRVAHHLWFKHTFLVFKKAKRQVV